MNAEQVDLFGKPIQIAPEVPDEIRVGSYTRKKAAKRFGEFAEKVAEQTSQALARITDPETSHAAAARVDVRKWEETVYRLICESEYKGMTLHDIMAILGPESQNKISPRFAPLVRKGKIFYCGEDRGGCSVWMDSQYKEEWNFIGSDEAHAKMDAREKKRQTPKQRKMPEEVLTGSLSVIGSIHTIDDPSARGRTDKPEYWPYSMLIQFDTPEQLNKAIADGVVRFRPWGK